MQVTAYYSRGTQLPLHGLGSDLELCSKVRRSYMTLSDIISGQVPGKLNLIYAHILCKPLWHEFSNFKSINSNITFANIFLPSLNVFLFYDMNFECLSSYFIQGQGWLWWNLLYLLNRIRFLQKRGKQVVQKRQRDCCLLTFLLLVPSLREGNATNALCNLNWLSHCMLNNSSEGFE